jgi:hypothetical protein
VSGFGKISDDGRFDPDEEDEDVEQGIDLVEVSPPLMHWAEVCAALKDYVRNAKGAPASQRDAIEALQEIDRVVRGADEAAPPDDLLGVGEGTDS